MIVDNGQLTINRFLAEHNQQSKPFTWTGILILI